MTTAIETQDRVDLLDPIINVCRDNTDVLCRYVTAQRFARDNFLHLINRRMKWTEVQTFVDTAMTKLRQAVSGPGSNVYSGAALCAADVAEQIVRSAVNRRKSFARVECELIQAVVTMIDKTIGGNT